MTDRITSICYLFSVKDSRRETCFTKVAELGIHLQFRSCSGEGNSWPATPTGIHLSTNYVRMLYRKGADVPAVSISLYLAMLGDSGCTYVLPADLRMARLFCDGEGSPRYDFPTRHTTEDWDSWPVVSETYFIYLL